jgi:ribosomal protein S18 acetylase RimI-like enzyme
VEIRRFHRDDRAALIALWENVFPDDPAHNKPSSVIDAKLAIDDLIFVADSGSDLIGACMAGYDGHRGWLYAVAVLKERRRSGAGRRLVNQALASLKELGCVKVNLQIRPNNTEVAAFYESLGFGVEDRLSMGALINENT